MPRFESSEIVKLARGTSGCSVISLSRRLLQRHLRRPFSSNVDLFLHSRVVNLTRNDYSKGDAVRRPRRPFRHLSHLVSTHTETRLLLHAIGAPVTPPI